MTIAPPALRAFLRLYAAGEFWESHEVLEGPWRESRDDFTQALILLASAWVHWQRGNAHGVQAQLAKTLARLEGAPSRHLGFDVAALRRHCREVQAAVSADPDGWQSRVRPLALEPPLAPAAGPVRVEACITSVEEARMAVVAGAHRLELCSALEVGGLTPSRSLMDEVLAAVRVPVHVLVRTHARSWQVTAADLRQMQDAVRGAVSAGAAGIVAGALDADGRVATEVIEALTQAARRASGAPPWPTLTFHRAFDAVADPLQELGSLVATGVERILTGGGSERAWLGRATLLELRKAAPAGLTVMAGGGVRADHVVDLVDATGIGEVHARAEGIPGVVRALEAAGLMAS